MGISKNVIYQWNFFNDEFLFLIYVVVSFLCPARDDTLFLRVKHNVANEF
jgi:hypothetical protein